jgi:hypothetical protein
VKLVLRMTESPAEGKVYVSLEEGPALGNEAGFLYALDCVPEDLLDRLAAAGGNEPVKEVGERLLQSLKGHNEVDLNIKAILAKQEPCPIYLRLLSPVSAQYPWETLFDPGDERFLALEERWPIARIADFGPLEKEVRYFAPPLCVLAVLSAVDVEGDNAKEWRSLWSALVKCSLPLKVHVVVGEHSLKEEIDALGDPRVECELLSSQAGLKHQIKDANPHLIHVFCHGRGAQSPTLMFGTPQDHVAKRSSVQFEADYLRGLAKNAWLVTLNCCEGASDREGVRSLAHLLVAAGYPAVVGMREPISTDDAHLFTGILYGSLIPKLEEELAKGEEIEIELTTVLSEPRQALRDKFVPQLDRTHAAAARREWTFPVLYVRPEPLRIQPEPTEGHGDGPASPEHVESRKYLTASLSQLHRARLELHADTPPAVSKAIDEKIEELYRRLAED